MPSTGMTSQSARDHGQRHRRGNAENRQQAGREEREQHRHEQLAAHVRVDHVGDLVHRGGQLFAMGARHEGEQPGVEALAVEEQVQRQHDDDGGRHQSRHGALAPGERSLEQRDRLGRGRPLEDLADHGLDGGIARRDPGSGCGRGRRERPGTGGSSARSAAAAGRPRTAPAARGRELAMTITLTLRAIRLRSSHATAGCSVTASRIAIEKQQELGPEQPRRPQAEAASDQLQDGGHRDMQIPSRRGSHVDHA